MYVSVVGECGVQHTGGGGSLGLEAARLAQSQPLPRALAVTQTKLVNQWEAFVSRSLIKANCSAPSEQVWGASSTQMPSTVPSLLV